MKSINFMYYFPFVDKGKKYIIYVLFTKNRTPKVNIHSNGDIVITDVPDVPNLSNITSSYYYLFVYKEGNFDDNLTLIYNLSSVTNNTFVTNINDKLQSKGWIAKRLPFQF